MRSFISLVALTSCVSAFDSIFNTTANATYAPYEGTCPALNASTLYNKTTHDGFIRTNSLISQDEYSYISARQVKTNDNLIQFLDGLSIPDYNETSFANYFELLNDSSINVGLALSGGGFRALFTGAGELMALDSRTTKNSSLKGLLDSSVYVSGLSGGAILLSTLAFNNWTSVESIIDDNSTSIWNTTGPPVSSEISFWLDLLDEVSPKKKAGYEISLIDLYGRILSRYMFEKDDDTYGLNTLWSDLTYMDSFIDYDMPFPMILAAGGTGSNITDYAPNLFEVNPYEFGSYSPFVGGFIPIEILGSTLNDGLPMFSNDCTFDFDNVGFLTAASANILIGFQSLLDGFLDGNATIEDIAYEELGTNISVTYVEMLMNMVNKDYNETLYALIDNPFYNSTLASNYSEVIDGETLQLVDGGFFDEVLPLDPMLVPSRQLDIVFAFDNSAQTEDNWPDGTTLFATEERWLESFPDDEFYALPSSTEEFVELGLNKKPVFFGCNGSSLITDENNPNATVDFNVMKPLLVYVPNTNLTAMSNITNYQFSYKERNAIVNNGFELALNDEEDDFAQCVGCAIIRRSEERAGIEISPFCSKCFTKYCFESTSDEQYDNTTIVESIPTTIYSSSALPSKMSSLLSKKTTSVVFPTSFPTSA